MNAKFLKDFGIIIAVVAVPAIVFYGFLFLMGETSVDYVVQSQRRSENRILFNSGIHQDYFSYKTALFRDAGSKIVVIGSSRSLQIRREFFNSPFTNLGAVAFSTASLRSIVAVLTSDSIAPPEIALVFVDTWWFNEKYSNSRRTYRPDDPPKGLSLVVRGAKTLTEQFEKADKRLFAPDRLGLQAKMSNEGFDYHGSYHYVSIVTGEKASEDARFADTRDKILNGKLRFEWNSLPAQRDIESFVGSVAALRAKGIDTIIIFPPFARQINELMQQSGHYGYVQELKQRLLDRGVVFFDYTDIAHLSSGDQNPDCEFVDGFHGGDVAYARILVDIAKSTPLLRNYLRTDYINDFIAANKGKAAGIQGFNRNMREVDFLRIGCR